ncbi:MAG: OprO/OprP family phosphate-selective porin, partial [Tannerellaceae bacterium]|nr:OprO/OprP family phosphate-selective porin [Tannerellaceae bacterium]
RVGQFKYPFTLENPYSPTTLETIENSTVISKLSGYSDESGIGANGREIGLALFGGFVKKSGYNLIDYYVGVVNGNGINNKDINAHKDFTGILTFNPIKPLAIAISHYNGKYGEAIKVDDKEIASGLSRTRTGFGAKYDDKKLLVRGEYLFGSTGIEFDENDKEVTKDGNGYYLTAAYYVAPKWQPVVKYDYYQSDDKKDASKQTNYIAGVNYYPIKNVRLQLNYTHRSQKDKDANRVAAQLLISF